MSIYAIGDLQGCYRDLQRLLQKIDYRADRDFLWFCGDIINRGPDSLQCLQFVANKVAAKEAVMVLGNHDLHLLAVAVAEKKPFKADTLDAILNSKDLPKYIDFLRQQPLAHYDPSLDLLMIHAGLIPQWNRQDAIKYNLEIQQVLQSDEYFHAFLGAMYGNEPSRWDDNLRGFDRWRFITNVLTRIRYCTDEGILNLTNKGNLVELGKGYQAWFQIKARKSIQDRIIFGHWAALYPDWNKVISDTLFPIDGGCVWGNALVALDLETLTYHHIDK